MDLHNLKKEERHIKVRCIDPKNNKEKFIPAHAVLDNCKDYGLIVQDLQVGKEAKKESKESKSK